MKADAALKTMPYFLTTEYSTIIKKQEEKRLEAATRISLNQEP
jgi:hypothetical protein